MEIVSFKQLPSTQHYLVESLKEGRLKAPVAVITAEQSNGVGSRDNSWLGGEGNFFASVAIELKDLPDDLKLSSASIYFSFMMKQVLKEKGHDVWLKWPNDLYINEEKIGGTITQKINQTLVCGIGVNLKKSQNGFRALQSEIEAEKLLETYLAKLNELPKWKQIFSEYEVEFEQSRAFSTHINTSQKNQKESLKDAILCEDGSLNIRGNRVYSLR